MQIQVEVSALVNEVDRIASHAQFNGMNMLTGRFSRPAGENMVTASMWLQIGANMDQRVRVFIGTMTADALGIRQLGSPADHLHVHPGRANRAIGTLDCCPEDRQQAEGGPRGLPEQAEYAVKGLDVGAENMQAAESRIRDADMASEMVEYTKNAIITSPPPPCWRRRMRSRGRSCSCSSRAVN